MIMFGLGLFSCNEDNTVPNPDEIPGDTDNDSDNDTEEPGDDGINIDFTEEQLKLQNKRGLSLTEAQREEILTINGVTLSSMGWLLNMCADDIWHSIGIECIPVADIAIDKEGINSLSKLISSEKCKRVLAFDIPESSENIESSVESAIQTWASLQRLQVPLGSPVIDATMNESLWFDAFMNKINELQYRVDYLCVKYIGEDLNTLKTNIEALQTKYNLPILVTGFALVDADAISSETNEYDADEVKAFMDEAITWFDEQEYIYGYAWTSFDIDNPVGCTSALLADGNLTPLGKYYMESEDGGDGTEPGEPQYGENLVQNPGFEDTPNFIGWTKNQWNVNLDNKITNPALSEHIISGDCTLRFSGKDWADVKQTLTVTKNKKYICGCTGRVQDAVGPSGSSPNTGNKAATITVNYIGTDGKAVKINSTTINSNTNTTVEFEVVVTDNMTENLRIDISKWQNCAVYIDDVYFKEVIE